MMKYKLQLALIAIALAALIGSSAGCVTIVREEPAPTAEEMPPVINSFTTTPAGINAGERTTLSWDVSGATEINIQPGIGKVGPSGTLMLTPADTITYTLTATNQAGSTTGSVTVTVTPVVVTAKPDLVKTMAATVEKWQASCKRSLEGGGYRANRKMLAVLRRSCP